DLGVTNNIVNSGFNRSATNFLGIRSNANTVGAGRATVGDIATGARAQRKAIQEGRTGIQHQISQLDKMMAENELPSNLMDQATKMRSFYEDQLSSLSNQNVKSYVREGLGYANRGAQWMTEGGARSVATKAAVGGAAWMGGNAVVRGASGGGMTYNSSGRRDI